MKAFNNLNQLLSRVKTIFGHKAHNEEKQTEPTTQQRSVSDQRLKAALTEVEKYLDDNVILLGYVKTDKGDAYLIEHLGNFIIFLKRLGLKHRIQHLAIAFSKEHYDTPYDIKNADITCVRLY